MQKSTVGFFVGSLLQAKEIFAVTYAPPYHTFKNIRQIYDVSLQNVKSSILIKLSLVYSMIEAVMKKNVVPSIALG